MAPTGEKAMDRPDLVDTVRSQPDLITARASVTRLELVADTGALDLAVDVADTIKARNSLEKMLAHQIAAAHGLAMKFAAKSEQMLGFVTSWDTTARQQVSSIEASRLANSAARMMESFNQGLLTLDRLRNGRRQLVSRYRAAFDHTHDPEAFAKAVANAGFATDPNYGNKLISIMRTHNLEDFDRV
jgi:hypothetical protein